MNAPQDHLFDNIVVGNVHQHRYSITEQVYNGFMMAFDDRSPVHVDEGFARSKGFDGRVMHGGILNGFLSHFIGMVFPGSQSLLLSADLRFSTPSYLSDELLLEAKVIHKLDAAAVVQLDVTFTNLTRLVLAARGRVQVKVGEPL
jgi:3-hydroxybutyryl-CoA dehydratase